MKRRRFFIHSLAHLVNDTYSGVLAPLLPLLCSKHGLSLTSAGLLVTGQTMAASLSQPLWGWFSDRHPSRWFIVGGVFSAGFFFSLVGVAPNVSVLVAVILAGGLGVACFHPMGTALASALVGRRKGLAIALFVTAGTTGYALGPVLISGLVAVFGLGRTYLAIFPAVIMVSIWLLFGPRISPEGGSRSRHEGQDQSSAPPIPWRPLSFLSGTSTVRAFVLLTFINFLPFHLKNLGVGFELRSLYLFTFQFGDAVGSLIGGSLSDRLGRWRVMFWSPLMSFPFLFLFLFTPGLISLIPLFIAGVLLFASAPAVVVGSQKLMLRREAMASAMQIGFAWGTAGLLMGLVGRAGELFGIYPVLITVAFFPLLMTLFAMGLKSARSQFEA